MGTGETPRVGEPFGERMARLEERQRAADRRADERHGELLGACHESTMAAREASAAVTEVGRSMAALTGRVENNATAIADLRKERDTDRYAPAPVYHESPSQPISVGPVVGPEPVDLAKYQRGLWWRQNAAPAGVGASILAVITGVLVAIAKAMGWM